MVGIELPPGFRFHPTDGELIMYYLRYKANSWPCPVSIIQEVDIYKFDPWELPDKAECGENEWYFFSPRDRKYPNGARPNRAAVSGYWKATGTDKAIYSSSKHVGVKKSLVFYKGKPPKGIKTDWIMHEYRLISELASQQKKQHGSMRLDDWVLCRIYRKKNLARVSEQKVQDPHLQVVTSNDSSEQQTSKFPRMNSLTHLWEFDYMCSMSQLLNGSSDNVPVEHQNAICRNGKSTWAIDTFQSGKSQEQQYLDAPKFQVNQPISNPMSEYR